MGSIHFARIGIRNPSEPQWIENRKARVEMLPPKRIVCPIDFSDYSQEAVIVATDLALLFHSTICLVHIVPVLPKLPASVSIFKEGEYEGQLHEDAKRRLEELVKGLSQKGVTAEVSLGTVNDIAMEIVRVAEHDQADLIVITSHGTTGWNRFVFGSVAEKVVHVAHCPVLVLRATGETKSASEPSKVASSAA
jgi:nucleotide-binding universal stress UspA family protein